MPLDGRLEQMIHIPGRLFSVNHATTRAVPRLFARNERIVNCFDTAAGPVAVILVGAIFVGSMDTVWAGPVTPVTRRITRWDYTNRDRPSATLSKGDELGRFNMGSTVILLFARDRATWTDQLAPGRHVRFGEHIGDVRSDS
jgi:phosphatidylserine decarboxylase